MLSYQHIYHAGNRADIHKHAALSNLLVWLAGSPGTSLYIETHAGRGLYDLRASEAEKTGEAKQGWFKILQDKAALDTLPLPYLDAVRSVNDGALSPFYPGSPKIAAYILRKYDRLRLYDLHPAEFAALKETMGKDPRIHLEKRDGLEAALSGAQMKGRVFDRTLVFIDPSYEVKSDYEAIPAFVEKLNAALPTAAILLWLPMLPALGHQKALDLMERTHPALWISRDIWSDPSAGRGMFGSLLLGINLPAASV